HFAYCKQRAIGVGCKLCARNKKRVDLLQCNNKNYLSYIVKQYNTLYYMYCEVVGMTTAPSNYRAKAILPLP
ncbi:hypothetical protein ACEV9J_23985, partial [Vibrio parahaemolyticus]